MIIVIYISIDLSLCSFKKIINLRKKAAQNGKWGKEIEAEK